MEILKKKRFQNLYTPEPDRKCTDIIWTIIGAIFAITMFVAACIMWNPTNFKQKFSSYNDDNKQAICTTGKYLYFPRPDNINVYNHQCKSHSCLSICPATYSNLNGLCLPIDDTARQQYLDNPEISVLVYGNTFFKVLFYTAIVTLGLGILNLCVVNIAPRASVKIGFALCILLLLAVGILLLVLYDQFWRGVVLLKILVAITCFSLALISLGIICMYSNQVKIYAIFVQYTTTFLSHNPFTYAYIPLFLLFAAGLVGLIGWQHCCYAPAIGSSRNIFNLNDSGAWGVFNILQFIWGIRFLRDAFNFCVSGNVVDWYWKKNANCGKPLQRLVCKNWGSVVAGSFFNAFFEIPCFIYQLLRCNPDTLCSSAGNYCESQCKCFSALFDLVRTDAYSFINISGQPYCISAKQCRRLCRNTDMFVSASSPMKHYRFTTHVAYICAVFLMAWFITRARMEYYGIWNSALIIVTALIIITWFINIFSDVGEALQTCFLYQHENQPNYNSMPGLDAHYKQDLYHHERRMKKDGTC